MGSFAPKGHAKLDPRHPAAFGHCDCCGFLYNHRDLRWQTQWMGNQLQRTGYLHCPKCFDQPNPTLRPIVLPADPVPILNPRPELAGAGTSLLDIVERDGDEITDRSGEPVIVR